MVLVAHSAGVLVTAHWAAQYSPTRVVGALLATPPALAAPSCPRSTPRSTQLRAHGWLPIPRRPLPFPSIVATSDRRPAGQPGAGAGPGQRLGQPDALARRRRPPQPRLRVRRVAAGDDADRGAADGAGPGVRPRRSSSPHDRGRERRRRARRGRRRRRPRRGPRGADARRWPGLVAAALGLGGAMLAHQLVPAIGVLTWAVALGMVAGNTGLLPRVARQALAAVTKRLLRIGIVLLGFAVSFGAIMALGVGTVGLVAGTLVVTLRRDHVARQPDEARRGPQPADRHRVRHLRGLGHRRDGGDRRGRRGRRRRRDRDGHPLRHRRPWCCCRCSPARWASATSSSASGPGPASTRSVRWSRPPAPAVPPSSRSPSSSS